MNEYTVEIKPGVFVDVYDTLLAFDVTCLATAHAIEKLLAPGERGAEDKITDLKEAVESIQRAIELTERPEETPPVNRCKYFAPGVGNCLPSACPLVDPENGSGWQDAVARRFNS